MSPGGTHAESATLRTADGGLLVHAVPAAFGCFTHDLPRASCVLAQPELADRPLTNAAEALGAVVVVKRGGVPFVEKARHAQQAGAAAVVIVNTAHEPYMAHGHTYSDGRVDDGRGLSVPVVCLRYGALCVTKSIACVRRECTRAQVATSFPCSSFSPR